jgi:hypothetical protein
MKIRIHVTKEILEKTKSCPCNIENCAISEAVRGIFPNAYAIYFNLHPFPLSYEDVGIGIKLPWEATLFIINFDKAPTDEHRAAMQPISFDIEVPDEVIEKIGINQVHKILSESKTLEYVQ